MLMQTCGVDRVSRLRVPISIEKEGLDKTLGEAVCETEQEKRQRKASERNLEELERS